MFAKELRCAGHIRKFSIRDAGPSGWEVRDEQDNRVLKHVHYTDWHRVERALNRFTLQIDDLEHAGWVTPRESAERSADCRLQIADCRLTD